MAETAAGHVHKHTLIHNACNTNNMHENNLKSTFRIPLNMTLWQLAIDVDIVVNIFLPSKYNSSRVRLVSLCGNHWVLPFLITSIPFIGDLGDV